MEQIIYKYKINYVIFPKSNLSYQYAGCLSVKTKFSIINNIVSVPVNEKNNLKLKTSIFSGKAFSNISLKDDHGIFILNKSSVELSENFVVDELLWTTRLLW